jgi:hypothetical protein
MELLIIGLPVSNTVRMCNILYVQYTLPNAKAVIRSDMKWNLCVFAFKARKGGNVRNFYISLALVGNKHIPNHSK